MASLKLRIKADTDAMRRDLRRLKRVDQPRAAAAALNKVRTKIRTRATPVMAQQIPIRATAPKRRARSRLWLPRGGRANRLRLRAVGLQLHNFVPKRWLFASASQMEGGLAPGEFIWRKTTAKKITRGKRKGQTKSVQTPFVMRRVNRKKITQVTVDASDRSLRAINRIIVIAGRVDWPREFHSQARRFIG